MLSVSFSQKCPAPLGVVFEYLDDYRNVADYWDGMVSYGPTGDRDRGVGAIFEGEMKLGPTPMRSRLETVAREQDTLFEYRSVGGIKTSISYRLAAVDEHSTTVDFRLEFELPGGVAGRAVERTVEPLVRASAKKTAENLAREVSAYYAARPSR